MRCWRRCSSARHTPAPMRTRPGASSRMPDEPPPVTRIARYRGHARAPKPEHVGHTVGNQTAMQASQGMARQCLWTTLPQQIGVVTRYRSDEHTGLACLQSVRDDLRVFEGLPAQLEHQTLLRVHHARLPRRYAEESGIEPVDLLQEAPIAGARRKCCVGDICRPAIIGHLGDRAGSRPQQLPEGSGIRCLGHSAGHPDYRNRRPVTHRLHVLQHAPRPRSSHRRLMRPTPSFRPSPTSSLRPSPT